MICAIVDVFCWEEENEENKAGCGLSIWDLPNSLRYADASTTDAYVRDLDVSTQGDRISAAYGISLVNP